MSGGVERHKITMTPHSRMEHIHGGPCPRCSNSATRTYYSDVTIHGQHRALILDTCTHCDTSRKPLQDNITGL